MLHFRMLGPARQLGHDRVAAWQRATRLAEALHGAGVPRYPHPTLVRPSAMSDEVWGVRETCCLEFRIPSKDLCLTCPLLPADRRELKWASSTLRPAAGGSGSDRPS